MNLALFDKLKALPNTYGGLNSVQEDLMYLMGCGSYEQFTKTLKGLLDPKHHCPFCTDQRNKFATSGRAHMGWYLKPNDFRGKDTNAWLIAIPNRHITDPHELLGEDWVAIGALFQSAINGYTPSDDSTWPVLEGGGLVMRFGDPRYHSGTIPHLHVNIIAPTGQLDFRTPLSKDEESRKKNYVRLLSHRDELLAKGGFEALFPPI